MSGSSKRRYFNELAAEWDRLPNPDDEAAKVRRFVEKTAAVSPQSILDVGCGTGILLAATLDRYPSVESVVEVDFAESMLRQIALKTVDPRVHRLCADAATLPFDGDTFDVVLCFGILPHLEDPLAALAELLRVLRPGGALSVGHMMSSRELNAFHSSLGGPVAGDVLPLAGELAATLSQLGARRTYVEEDPGWYFVRAEKGAS